MFSNGLVFMVINSLPNSEIVARNVTDTTEKKSLFGKGCKTLKEKHSCCDITGENKLSQFSFLHFNYRKRMPKPKNNLFRKSPQKSLSTSVPFTLYTIWKLNRSPTGNVPSHLNCPRTGNVPGTP